MALNAREMEYCSECEQRKPHVLKKEGAINSINLCGELTVATFATLEYQDWNAGGGETNR